MIEIQRWLYSSATSELKNIAGGADAIRLASAMGVAALFGFVHALMPGHGKIALVSYYIGYPGRLLGSIGASAVLILTHVGSAVILVLAGFTVIRATLGGVGRAPAFEVVSAMLVTVVGLWLLVRAIRHRHESEASSGLVAFATGLVPCPLTTFIMVYLLANGILIAGLLITAAMTVGMIATIFLFVGCTILVRGRALRLFERTAVARENIGRALEITSALLIIAFGIWLLATRAA